MKQKTKLEIVQKISSYLSLQNKYTPGQRAVVWASYIMQIVIFQLCLLVSIIQPKLHVSQTLSKYSQIQLTLFILRINVSCLYMVTKSVFFIPVIKVLQGANLYLVRSSMSSIPLIFQLIAQIYLTIRKQKRFLNFDSRLENKYYGTKVFALYIILFSTFLTPNSQISKNPSAVLFCAIIYYVGACLDNIYSYRSKEILRNIALCPILMSIYFMCLPLFNSLNTFGLVAHSTITFSIMLILIFYAVTQEYAYHHDILYKKILNLQSRDKLLYLWSMIHFIQNPTINGLICFIKTHQSKCFNSLCPLNFNNPQHVIINSSNQLSAHQGLKKAVKLYLNKALERFASQSDQIRRLFIYYRKQDDPKIVHLLRQDDVYQKIQQFRISKNLQSYNDISLEYEQMKQIQAQTLSKVKLFLNHYDYFLAYINKQSIKMQTSQQIIKELIKLKNYFLSFRPNADLSQLQDEKKSEKSNKSSVKNKKGYQKIQQQTIPIKKMTLKTTILVNFMRKVYFNLPTLEKEQAAEKKFNYISQDFQQSPILIISAESYNLGKIINWNTMAQKTLLYPTKQMKTKFVNDMLPKAMHKTHQKIFMKASLAIQIQQVRKSLSAYVFCYTKSGYAQVFDVKIQGTSSISGNKWIVELKHQYQNQSIIIVDQKKNIVGINKNCINVGITQNQIGQAINEQLFNQLAQAKSNKDKIIVSNNMQSIQGFTLQQQTQWQLACTTPKYQDLPFYYFIMVEKSFQIEKMTLSRFTKKKANQNNVNNMSQTQNFNNQTMLENFDNQTPTNGFQFKFDPFTLKYTNFEVQNHQQSDLELIWQQKVQQQIAQQYPLQNDRSNRNSLLQNQYLPNGLISSENKSKNYSQNIHQMIYFDKKLEFKQNYEIATQFQTHPNYLPNGKMNGQKMMQNLNKKINKQNFIDNINKIKKKMPVFVYQLVILFLIAGLVFLIGLSLRFTLFNSLYKSIQQKESIDIQMINRKNLIADIGSLSIYLDTTITNYNSSIWSNYIANNWTYQQLFVEIQYTNNRINSLNGQIGMFVNKQYPINGAKKSLASYFEALSIQASTQITGKLNLTAFIQQIVDDITKIQSLITIDTQNYYKNLSQQLRRNVYIIDSLNLLICVVSIIILHFILRKAYLQRVALFKSLSVVEQEQIYRIQKNLNDHRQQIKNNELDSTSIVQDDYSEQINSQNIPHTKKMFYTYFKSRFIFFYGFMLAILIVAAFFFLISDSYYKKQEKIELVSPFVNIVGEQRNSMTKMFLNVLANTKNSSYISTDIMKNIRMFQINKKGVIDSLIAKQFSQKYVDFYNSIWFSPCEMLGVSSQCSKLFSGILADNLDYNYVYVLTQVQKIVDYRIQKVTPPLSLDPQFIKDVEVQITKSLTRINFLLFNFMVRLQQTYTAQSTQQINYLYDKIQSTNLYSFLGFIISNFVMMGVVFFLVYTIKNVPNETLQMITTVIPIHLLMRNQYFVEWYIKKFKNVY